MRGDTTTLFGLFAYWLAILAALMIAFSTLGLTHVTDLLRQMVLFAPKLLVAMLAVVFGSYFARFVGSAVIPIAWKRGFRMPISWASSPSISSWCSSIMIALSQVEIGGDIVQRTFLVILGGIVLALALAFGLGGKDWAAALLERWWPRQGPKDGR